MTIIQNRCEIVDRSVEVIISLRQIGQYGMEDGGARVTYLKLRTVDPSNLGTNIVSRLLERRRRVQVEVLKSVEVEYS